MKSRFVDVLSGLPQGTVLAALLYLVFINDLPESVTKSFTGIFCDDTILAKQIDNKNDGIELQNDLDHILIWTKLWGMQFNTVKCVHMSITNKRKPIINRYHLNNKILKQKNMVKYLGVIIDDKLNFDEHIKQKSRSATTILNMLRRNLYFAPMSVKCKAYKACVLPIVEYASNCWSPTSAKMNNLLEMVQHKAARFITNTYARRGNFNKFSITKILSDLNFDTLENRRKQARLAMAYKIINGDVILDPNLLPKFKYSRPMRQCNSVKVGKENQLVETNSELKITGYTFFYSVPKIWNVTITAKQAKAPSVDAFKKHFQ